MSIFNSLYRLFIHKKGKAVLFPLIILVGIIGLVIYGKPAVSRAAVQFGTVTPWVSPEYASKNGKDTVNNIGSPGQFSFCALAYRWENTGGDKDSASCRVALVGGNQWTLSTQTRQDANVVCQAVCYSATPVVIPPTGTIQGRATKTENGQTQPWDSPPFIIDYSGPDGIRHPNTSIDVPVTYTDMPSGTYTVYSVTHPDTSISLKNINGSSLPYSTTLSQGGTITVTYNFVTAPPQTGTIKVLATIDGVQQNVSFTANMTMPGTSAGNVSINAPQDIPAVAGLYTVNGIYHPTLTISSITPSMSQPLSAGGTITFTVNFVTTTVPHLPTLAISPTSWSMNVGDTKDFTAIYDPDGSDSQSPYAVTNSANWTSSNAGVANIIGISTAVGASAGSATITASYSGLTASAPLTVTALVFTPTLVVTPADWPLAIGGTKLFLADYDPDGSSGPQTLQQGVSATWSSVASTKVYINPDTGLAERGGHGGTSIFASYAGLTAPATVFDPAVLNVRPTPNNLTVGESVQLQAYLDPDGSGPMLEGTTPVTNDSIWSSNRTFAPIEPAVKGKVNAVSAGTNARITANYQGITNRAIVNVAAVPPTPQPDLMISIAPSLNSGSLTEGSPITFKGTVKNSGDAVAGGTFNNRFRIDGATILTGPIITALAIGASSPSLVSGMWTATAGNHTIELCADQPTPSVSESNEGNNCATSSSFTVFAVLKSIATLLVNGALTATIDEGDSVELTWTSTNGATSCDSDFSTDRSPNKASPGVQDSPSENKAYSIYCTNAGGVGPTASVSVTVVSPVVSIKASPICVRGGGNSTIKWNATPASLHCDVSGPGLSRTGLTGSAPLNDSATVNVTAESTYKISCTTAGGTTVPEKSVTVKTSGCLGTF